MIILDRLSASSGVTIVFGLINFKGQKPGYLELSRAIIEAAESGRLPPNSPLPPSRILAQSLGVSRDTVLRCYRHLSSLGWTESHGTKGTFVGNVIQASPLTPDSSPLALDRLSRYGNHMLSIPGEHFFSLDPVTIGAVPKECLPIRRWKLATQRASEPLSVRDLQYEVAVLGRPELRSAASAYLNRAKGIACTAEEIVVFNISFTAMSLICRLVMDPGEVIAVEEPGYGGAREVADYLGLEILRIPIDADGMSIEALEKAPKKIKMIHVTPNHQEPTGVTMTLARRRQIVAWAQRNKVMIIEDDYDGHLHYGATMPPSLKSMDTQDNVIFLGGFWQLLYPLTTLCYAAVPYSFIGVLQSAKRHTVSLTENLAQLALAEILNDGYLQKHTRKLERLFGERRRAVIYELKRTFGARVHVPPYSGGLNMMAQFIDYPDKILLGAAKMTNLPLGASDAFYFDKKMRKSGEFLIWFAGMEESTVRKTIENFAKYLEANREG
jgi:GntR family transcriptional regulator/MocR family aminotransferase